MGNARQQQCLWHKELKRGWQNMLRDRLKFHGGLCLDEVAKCTSRSKQTVRKHFRRAVDSGIATWSLNRERIKHKG